MPSFFQNKQSFSANRKIQLLLGAIVLYLASTGVFYMIFNTVDTKFDIPGPLKKLTDITSDKEAGDRPCPINGFKYTKAREDTWKDRRPLAVMVENHTDARPIIGLSRADTVYEAVAEGGITRFMGIFLCQDVGDIAPIRSARTYYIDWLSEYDAAYAHVGGANTPGKANALGQIRDYEIKDMDQFGLGYPTYWRGTDKLAPHNVHSTTTKLWEAAKERGFGAADESGARWDKNFKSWTFKDDAAIEQRGDQKPIVVTFWDSQPDYAVTWQYDKTTNHYKRFHGQTEQIDPITLETLAPKAIIVQYVVERDANDGYPDGHLLYGTTGSGNALIFQDGKVIAGKWQKQSRTARSTYLDSKGKEIELNRGLIWIQAVPVGVKVQY